MKIKNKVLRDNLFHKCARWSTKSSMEVSTHKKKKYTTTPSPTCVRVCLVKQKKIDFNGSEGRGEDVF